MQVGTGPDHAGVTFVALRRLADIFEVVGRTGRCNELRIKTLDFVHRGVYDIVCKK